MYDLILRGGTVVDGKRSQPYAADICIREGRIARIAPEGGGGGPGGGGRVRTGGGPRLHRHPHSL